MPAEEDSHNPAKQVAEGPSPTFANRKNLYWARFELGGDQTRFCQLPARGMISIGERGRVHGKHYIVLALTKGQFFSARS